jgi:hypothetical protein
MSFPEEARQRPEESQGDYKARLETWQHKPAMPYLESVAVSRALREVRKRLPALERAKLDARALTPGQLQEFIGWLVGGRKRPRTNRP